jgi:hypothetical protein
VIWIEWCPYQILKPTTRHDAGDRFDALGPFQKVGHNATLPRQRHRIIRRRIDLEPAVMQVIENAPITATSATRCSGPIVFSAAA